MSHVHANVRRVRHVHVCMCLCRCVTHKLYAITLRHVFGAYSTEDSMVCMHVLYGAKN